MSNGKLICESHVKEYVKLKVKNLRPGWDCRFVSQNALDVIDAKLRNIVINAIKRHPTKGKTFRYVQ